MAEVMRMPHMSDTMEEGVIVKWHKDVGDKVESGDIIADVETDKATMELESFQDGILLHKAVEEGEAVPVEDIIAILGEKGEDIEGILKEEQQKKEKQAAEKEEAEEEETPKKEAEEKAEPEKEKAEAEKTAKEPEAKGDTVTPEGRIKASPLARKMAGENDIALKDVKGTGDAGRIIKRDIETYLEKRAAAPAVPGVKAKEGYEDKPLSQMRKAIARRLAQSKFFAPHFYLTMEINMDRAVAARKSMNAISDEKISFNDLIVKVCATALRQHPQVNATWKEDKLRYFQHIHIGVAVAVDEGLIVPVLRFADHLTLSQIAAASKQLAGKAKDKKLEQQDYEGNTFTVSNLGMFDIDEFTAIINPPDSCILAVGKIKETPIVADGEVTTASIMKITLSCDHRVVDGATGARFLQSVKAYLEDPVRMLI